MSVKLYSTAISAFLSQTLWSEYLLWRYWLWCSARVPILRAFTYSAPPTMTEITPVTVTFLAKEIRGGLNCQGRHPYTCPGESYRPVDTNPGWFYISVRRFSRSHGADPCHAKFARHSRRQRDLHVQVTGILLDSFLSPCKDRQYANSPQYPHSP